MAPTRKSIRQAWADLARPPGGNEKATKPVPGTNAWVFKSPDGGFGMVLTGVSRPARVPSLQNINFGYKPEKEIRKGTEVRRIHRCFEVELAPECDQETLVRLVERLSEEEASGHYTTNLLLQTIKDVVEIVEPQKAGASRPEALGAWGELHVLHELLQACRSPAMQRALIAGWEAAGTTRDVIDLRVPKSRIALEIKTGQGRRVHRIHGHGQVQVPSGYRDGYLVSVLAEEAPDGWTCHALGDRIRESFVGAAAERETTEAALNKKLDLRGVAARDDRFPFTAGQSAISVFHMSKVPSPPQMPSVSDVEWNADLGVINPEPESTWEEIKDVLDDR